jgi:hypothetical protein
VKYELGFYIPEDGILHSRRREILLLESLAETQFLFCEVQTGFL